MHCVQVLQTLSDDERRALTPLTLRQKAREFALETVESQKVGFQRFGVWADWQAPYVTLAREYEAAQIGVFGKVRPRMSTLPAKGFDQKHATVACALG